MINNDEEDMTNDEESWSGMEDYDEGRVPDPTNEDALDWDDEMECDPFCNICNPCDGENEDQD